MYYLYIKAFHIISIIAWMVSLLYLPRLFVYHSQVLRDTKTYEIFLLMERRLIYLISLPSFLLSSLFGAILIYENNMLIYENYFLLKVLCICLLIIYHYVLILFYIKFKKKENINTSKFYKVLNEIPTLLMIIIILLVVLKPNLG